MPVDEHVLGFSNRWYPAAIETAQTLEIAEHNVRVVTPALFIATKLEAFHGRGGNDVFASHDLEDIIAVVDGRSEIVDTGHCLAAVSWPPEVCIHISDNTSDGSRDTVRVEHQSASWCSRPRGCANTAAPGSDRQDGLSGIPAFDGDKLQVFKGLCAWTHARSDALAHLRRHNAGSHSSEWSLVPGSSTVSKAMSPRHEPRAGTSSRRPGADAVAATLVALLMACQSQPRDVEGIVRAALERRSWPAASVLVVDHGRVLANVGHRTPQERDPQDLVYPLGSIGKMFTAAAVHRLTERGEVALGARVAEYLPDWPPSWNAVRVHQLLGHTSGIADFWFVPEAATLAGNPTARAIDLARVMAQVPLEFEPGTRFSYSNTAYHAAARIIERRTGLSYDAYLAREFFMPMGMTSMHHCRGDAGEMAGHVLRDGEAVAVPHENDETARGDGGLCGSARDLARWFQAIAHFECATDRCPAIRLHMAGMEWPGQRVGP